jgi:hypothetical protein
MYAYTEEDTLKIQCAVANDWKKATLRQLTPIENGERTTATLLFFRQHISEQ